VVRVLAGYISHGMSSPAMTWITSTLSGPNYSRILSFISSLEFCAASHDLLLLDYWNYSSFTLRTAHWKQIAAGHFMEVNPLP